MKSPLSVNAQIAKWRSNPEFAAAYDALEEEFALAAQRIDARASDNMLRIASEASNLTNK